MDESRRGFLKTGAKALAAVAAAEGLEAWQTQLTVLGASDRVRVAIVGLRGAGAEHIRRFGALPNVEIVALCDIDDSVMREQIQLAQKLGFRPKTYIDIRKLLEDKSIDAVSIATQNHWHSLMAIWACQAGKDVYVEKPCSHNLWEGRQLVRAAAKYDRIVQHGTQYRSNRTVMQAVKEMRSGLLGDVYLSRGLCLNGEIRSATPLYPRFLLESITISGLGRRLTCPSPKTTFITTGIGFGTMETAISATRAFMSSILRDGVWMLASLTKSPPSAATLCLTMTSRRLTR